MIEPIVKPGPSDSNAYGVASCLGSRMVTNVAHRPFLHVPIVLHMMEANEMVSDGELLSLPSKNEGMSGHKC